MKLHETPFSDLVGQTLTRAERIKTDNDEDEILFVSSTGEFYKLYHDRDCCEDVYIEDICGELSDLVGSPIIQAEEVSSEGGPPSAKIDPYFKCPDESFTWTFYRIATATGQVVIRWYGTSNGYYSEGVSFAKLQP